MFLFQSAHALCTLQDSERHIIFLSESLHIFYTYNSLSHLSRPGFQIACMFDEMGLDIHNVKY